MKLLAELCELYILKPEEESLMRGNQKLAMGDSKFKAVTILDDDFMGVRNNCPFCPHNFTKKFLGL